MEKEQNRDRGLKNLRPDIPVIMEEKSVSPAELFQNKTLRQICKLQHDLLKLIFENYIQKRKGAYFKLNEAQRLDYIKHSVDKDLNFRSLLVGMVVGHFTAEEWAIYLENENENRKRLTNLLVQRLQSMDFE